MHMYMHAIVSSQGRAASFLHTGCPESSIKLFLLLIIYHKILWTYSQDNYMEVSNTSFFYIFSINFNSLVPVTTASIPFFVPVWILYLQPPGHFFSNHAIIPKPFPMNCTSEGSKKDEIWGSTSGLNGGWGMTVHLSFVTASCVFKLLSVQAFSSWRRISSTFLCGWTQSEMLQQDFKSLTVQILVNGLTTWHHHVEAMPEQL
jgi:hypothetical protein